jgi:hypothetical protein
MRHLRSSSIVLPIIAAGAAACLSKSDPGGESSTTQDIGEDACGTAIEDETWFMSHLDWDSTRPGGGYGTGGDHPACPNQYILDVYTSVDELDYGVAYEGPDLSPNDYGGCSAEWVAVTLWRYYGGRNHRMSTKIAYGTQDSGCYNGCCAPAISDHILDYTDSGGIGSARFVISAGVIYSTVPVQLDASAI